MKKNVICSLLTISVCVAVNADMQKDPITNKFYSIPATPEINQEEYNELLFRCWMMSEQIINHPAFKGSGKEKDAIAHLTAEFLTRIGTATALRLFRTYA